MARESLRGVAGARFAADRLVQRLARELAEARGEAARLRELLEAKVDSEGDPEVLRREAIARPVLAARVAGRPDAPAARRRRNVAWHAASCPPAGAEPAAWRKAERGPRLGAAPRPAGAAHGGASREGAARPPLEIQFEICVAEPAVKLGRPAEPRASLRSCAQPFRSRRTPLRSGATPYVPFRQLSCEETAEEVLAALDFWPPAPVDRAEPGPPRDGAWKADVVQEGDGAAALQVPCRAERPQVGGAAGAGALPPPLEHLGGPTREQGDSRHGEGESAEGSQDSTVCSATLSATTAERNDAVTQYLLDNYAALLRGGIGSVERDEDVEGSVGGDCSSYVSSVSGVFRDYGPVHGQYLIDEFSDGSERAAEYDLERVAWLAQGSPSFAEQCARLERSSHFGDEFE
ncbi:unnamed protein product [Prorocentrum cordatum]|uniref:Uncharacterized protein n=1 Tax=Prorocentrum cordatum TaxID=2364126 RepID=A0ABN9V6J1_9DINO|nr:unnamed protein product [Polarella glacialis]